MKDMQSGCLQYNLTDLWATDRPAYGQNGTGVYEEFLFRDTLLDIVEQHNTSQPLFLFYAPHVAHCPLQVPKEWFDMVRSCSATANAMQSPRLLVQSRQFSSTSPVVFLHGQR